MKPLVSIIIPSYNHSKYITETLDSVVNDTYPNKEIVIIDDGSKDNSVEIINEWIGKNLDQQVNFIVRSNKGLCSTLNELVDKAEGEYLIPLASDDQLVNNTISERVEILNNSAEKVLIADAEVIDGDGQVSYKSMLTKFHNVDKNKYKNADSLLDEIIFNFSISGPVVMMKADIFKLVGKYPKDLKAEDLYFYISAAAQKELLFYDQIVSRYRVHDSNTSGDNFELLHAVTKTYERLFFKIPGVVRKMKLLKRLMGIHYNIFKFNNKL